MLSPRPIGFHAASDRQVFLLTLDSLPAPWIMPQIEGRHFTCFCAMDARNLKAGAIGEFCSRLLEQGCAYLCTWGPDCERVHDLMDEEIVGGNPPQSEWGGVITTWHADDSLDDALDYFLSSTYPDEAYAPDGCKIALAISVGSVDWNAALEQYLVATTRRHD